MSEGWCLSCRFCEETRFAIDLVCLGVDTPAEIGPVCKTCANSLADNIPVVDALREEIKQLKTQLAGCEAAIKERDELKDFADNWKAIVGCERVRVLGCAGVGRDFKGDGYAHIGVDCGQSIATGRLTILTQGKFCNNLSTLPKHSKARNHEG